MTAATLVTRWDLEAALARIDKGQGTHDDANLIRAALQAMENQARNELEDTLVYLYKAGQKPSYVVVAELCDETLDRSGALLGRIRERATMKAKG